MNMAADGVLRAADTIRAKFTQVGTEGGKAGEKMLVGLGKSLLTAAALIKVLNGVAEAYNQAATNAAKISRESGGRQLSAELAGQRLGLNAGQTSSLLSTQGPRSLDDRSGFLSALASATGPGGRKLDAGTALEASRIYNEGTVDQGEIIDTLSKRGRRGLSGLANTSAVRRASLGDVARDELFNRTDEVSGDQREADTIGSLGALERRRLATEKARRAENPAAFGFVDAVSNAGGGKIVEAGQRALDQIAENTRPRLNTSANGP